MIPLHFYVNGQFLQRDPKSPFRKLVAGSSELYNLTFTFSDDWAGFRAIAVLKAGSVSYEVPIVNGTVSFPGDLLEYHKISVRVAGKNGDTLMNTTESSIIQTGGITT